MNTLKQYPTDLTQAQWEWILWNPETKKYKELEDIE